MVPSHKLYERNVYPCPSESPCESFNVSKIVHRLNPKSGSRPKFSEYHTNAVKEGRRPGTVEREAHLYLSCPRVVDLPTSLVQKRPRPCIFSYTDHLPVRTEEWTVRGREIGRQRTRGSREPIVLGGLRQGVSETKVAVKRPTVGVGEGVVAPVGFGEGVVAPVGVGERVVAPPGGPVVGVEPTTTLVAARVQVPPEDDPPDGSTAGA